MNESNILLEIVEKQTSSKMLDLYTTIFKPILFCQTNKRLRELLIMSKKQIFENKLFFWQKVKYFDHKYSMTIVIFRII